MCTEVKINYCMGIDFDYSAPWEFQVYIISYIRKILEYLPKKLVQIDATHVAHHIFKIQEKQGEFPPRM